LLQEGLHPLESFADTEGKVPSPWARKYWKVFIDRKGWVRNAIEYVEENPVKEGKQRQQWKLVAPYGT
jgi:hypothetical protein